jgi:hypothetical protein
MKQFEIPDKYIPLPWQFPKPKPQEYQAFPRGSRRLASGKVTLCSWQARFFKATGILPADNRTQTLAMREYRDRKTGKMLQMIRPQREKSIVTQYLKLRGVK